MRRRAKQERGQHERELSIRYRAEHEGDRATHEREISMRERELSTRES